MTRSLLACLLLLSCGAPSAAGDAPLPTLEQVAVRGQMPGPGLWQVRRDGHVLWVLASLAPLPRRMEWRTDELAERVAGAQAVLAPPGVRFEGVGPVQALFLLPSLMGARKNPDKATLSELLPEDLHARWRVLKQRYLGRDRGVERWRPLFAGDKLFEEALEEHGLSERDLAWPALRKLAKQHDLPVLEPTVALRIEDPRGTVNQFRKDGLEDLRCFERTLARLEQNLPDMQARAAAWAIGDIERLRELPDRDQRRECTEALLHSRVAGQAGLDQLPERVRTAWLQAAEAALAEHRSTVAVLPLATVLAADGLLARLAARGYEVIAPE